MVNLTSPAEITRIQKQFGISTLKQLGQNFLYDANMLEKIADCGGFTKADVVLEIGPGMGALTQRLAQRAGKVVAVEIDKGLLPVLNYTLEGFDNVTVVHGDFLKQDLNELHVLLGGGPFWVCANLPYYITTPIIMRLIESALPFNALCFLVQKEVAERMAASPGNKSYGSLSIAVQYHTKAKIVLKVPPTCFIPSPSVDSVVMRLDRCPPPVKVADEALFKAVCRSAFAMRRKTLANNLAASPLALSREKAEEAIALSGLSEKVRGEALSLDQFAKLANTISQMRNKQEEE